ncbi:MAG: hypothetical protein ACXU86_08620, partial [Archangium sp.]
MGLARPRPSALGVVDEELRARAWRGAAAGILVIALAELAYVFIDYQVFHGPRLPVLRALHALGALLLLGVLWGRRRLPARLAEACFVGALLPLL